MDIKIKVWGRIKDIRKERWLSQEKLASKSKLHRTYISAVERWLKNISIENVEKIAMSLDVEVNKLFENWHI